MQRAMRMQPFVRLTTVCLGLMLLGTACSKSGQSGGSNSPGGAANNAGGGNSSAGGSNIAGGANLPDAGTSPPPDPGATVGQTDPPAGSPLSGLSKLANVVATQREDSVGIDFDPVDGAVDYRVYALPADADVTVSTTQAVTVKNGLYRCAGVRETQDVANNLNSTTDANGQTNPIDTALSIAGGVYPPVQTQVPTNPQLGFVYVAPGDGRVPVYAVAVYPSSKELGWRESRPKIYTTDSSERQRLLGLGGRDDGIVFYAPSAAAAGTQPLYHSELATLVQGPGWSRRAEYYFLDADRAAHSSDTTPPVAAFQILKDTVAGAVPLMSVLYRATHDHTELSAGKERFNRASKQGPGPAWHLEWSGVTAATTLVVEALASGCPYQGLASPQAVLAPPHQPLMTLDQLHQGSTTGEVFLNGQYDMKGGPTFSQVIKSGPATLITPDASPVALARSFIKVTPHPHDAAAWDWYQGFNVGSTFGTLTPVQDLISCKCSPADSPLPCNGGNGACGYWTSPTLNVGMYEVDSPNNVALFASGQVLGQFWDVFDDFGQDVTSELRFTAPTQATVGADGKFLHVTWTVNTASTDRRYPQLVLSDQPDPVQDGFFNPDSDVMLIQTIDGPSPRLQVEAFHGLFNGKPWAVNNQAPFHALIDYDSGLSPTSATDNALALIPPYEPPFEHSGVDRLTKYDAYVSSDTLYVFMDGAPAGCTRYPSNGFALKGAVSVSFGDVLYHEGAMDELICYQSHPYPFMQQHMCTETKRVWDDLGFKNGVAAPQWDSSKYPCQDY